MRSFMMFAIVLLTSTLAGSGQQRMATMDAYFAAISGHQLFDGNLAMAENNQMVYVFSGGYADCTRQKANHRQTHFNLASISKIFTSTAVLQLRDAGKLSLNDDLVKYLPEFPFTGITVRHLLTHSSGLPDLELYEEVIKQYPDTVIRNTAVIPLLRQWKKGLYFTPGDQFRYCNTNYTLLAMLVERLTGGTFAAYVDKHIFKPAGMKDTYVAEYGTAKFNDTSIAIQQVKPTFFDTTYLPVSIVPRYKYTEYNNQGSIGPSNVITTVDDMLGFDQAFFGGKLLKAATVEEALTPMKLNNGQEYSEHMDTMLGEGKGQYGLGWEIFMQPGFGKGVGHGGFKFGLATFYYHNLARNQAIVGYSNNAAPAFGAIVTSGFYLLNSLAPMPLSFKTSAVRAYAKALMTGGPDHAAGVLHTCMADTVNYYFRSKEMNFLGYDFLYQAKFDGHQQLSLETFKLYTFLEPADFNTYDSYGEALMKSGNKEDAIVMYKRSLALNPQNEGGAKALRKLLGAAVEP